MSHRTTFAVATLLLAATLAHADDGLPFEKDPMGTLALENGQPVLQVGAVTYELTNEEPASVLAKFPGSSALLYGQATHATDTRYKLAVEWMYCPEGDVFDDPSVSQTPRGKVPAGKVRLLFAAQDPGSKVWWVRIAYEGGPLVANQESWVKADLLFKKPEVVTVVSVAPVASDATPRTCPKNVKGTVAVEDGKTVVKSGDVTYEVQGEETAETLAKFAGQTVSLSGQATKTGEKRFTLADVWATTPGGDVVDDPSVSEAPRGEVPAGKVKLLFAAQDPDTKVWWVRIAYEGGPHVSNEESWVKSDLVFSPPTKTTGVDGALEKTTNNPR